MFLPSQIVCIDSCANTKEPDNNTLLIAEVIQMVPDRDRCWARPLALAEQRNWQLHFLHDLRETSQLILPTHLFREALDTEVMPIITELMQRDNPAASLTQKNNCDEVSRQALHCFVRNISPRHQ